jgi:hypothetical protein
VIGGWRRHRIYDRVVLNTRDGQAFDGVLYGWRGELVLLRDARLLREGHAVKLDGEVIFNRDAVAFIQVPPR